jgi:predicted transcriptional regulator
MAEAQRFVIALVASVLFMSSLPHIAAEQNDELGLTLEIMNDAKYGTYIEGETILIEANLVNHGNSVVYKENPACNGYLTVEDSSGKTVYSNLDQCRDQSRDSLIEKGQIIEQSPITWDFRLYNDSFVDSGSYKITLHHSKMNLSDSIVVRFTEKPQIYQNIVLELKTNEIDTHHQYISYLVQIGIKYTGTENLPLGNNECVIKIMGVDFTNQIESCFSGTTTLHANENIYAGHMIFTEQNYNFSEPIYFQLYGSDNIKTLLLDDEHQNPMSGDAYANFDKQLNDPDFEVLHEEQNGELLINLKSLNEDHLRLDDLCNISVDIYRDLGELYSSDKFTVCDSEVSSTEVITKEIYTLELIDEEQCFIPLGKYTAVIQIEEDIFSFDFNQLNKNIDPKCYLESYDSSFYLTVHKNSIYTTIDISSHQNTLRIDSECLAGLKIEQESSADNIMSYCGYSIGNFIDLDGESITFDEELDIDGLEFGENVWIQFSTFIGPTIHETRFVQTDLQQSSTSSNFFEISGVWSHVEYELADCWMLSAPNSIHLIDASQLSTMWRPNYNWEGTYKVKLDHKGGGDCGIFGIPIVVIEEIYHESEPIKSVEVIDQNTDKSENIDIVSVTITGTASASILVTLVLLISNTESMRIPVTSAGLWMLALVGKTHETSDGRFQRGRLIGYLTANPGCHFRALMAALNMSNGQITHHLRLLENQELIWRINDGRFVRYYPLNNSLYPGMNPDDLPVPPLSPDPKSLQGKILTLLDDEHQIGEFPTQSELAKKLEKSQQLISHHLRTLQKYGLVEKRKMGIKNRYKLTKEALFLLETDMDYNKIRD